MRNSSICAGRSGAGGAVSSQAVQVGRVVEAERALRPGARGGLDDQGETHSFGKFEGVSGADGQLVPGAGDAGLLQHGLHPVLVAEAGRRGRVHPRDAQVLADLCQRDLQLLQHGQQPADRAELAGQALDRGGELDRVQRVVDPPVAGQVLLQLRRQPVRGLAGDQRGAHAGQPGRRLDEPRRGVQQVGGDEAGGHHGIYLPSGYHARHERGVRGAVLPRQPAAVRPGPGAGRRHRDRHRRVRGRVLRRRPEGLAAPLRAGVLGHRCRTR